MSEARLQRTRDAYPPDQGPTLSEFLEAMPTLPPRPSHLVTDPATGHTSRVFESPAGFMPWNVIEGEDDGA